VVGNHYVETSEGRDGCGHQLLRRCAGGKVRLHGPAVRGTTFADEVFSLGLRRLIVEDDFGAGLDEHSHGGSAIPREPPVIRATLELRDRFIGFNSMARTSENRESCHA